MAEYLEREEVKRIIKANSWLNPVIPNVVNVIVDRIPAADVIELRHGECPICGGKQDIKQDCNNGYYVEVDREQCEMSVWLDDECLAVFSIDYCPNCGAKMDGKGEGE